MDVPRNTKLYFGNRPDYYQDRLVGLAEACFTLAHKRRPESFQAKCARQMLRIIQIASSNRATHRQNESSNKWRIQIVPQMATETRATNRQWRSCHKWPWTIVPRIAPCCRTATWYTWQRRCESRKVAFCVLHQALAGTEPATPRCICGAGRPRLCWKLWLGRTGKFGVGVFSAGTKLLESLVSEGFYVWTPPSKNILNSPFLWL